MSRLSGRFIDQEASSGDLDQDELAALSLELGIAVGKMVDLDLPRGGQGLRDRP